MGIDISQHLGLGFVFKKAELLKAGEFVVQPLITHIEERKDERTGRSLAPVVVVDREEKIGWRLRGKIYGEEDYLKALAKLVGADYYFEIENGDDYMIAIGLTLPVVKGTGYDGDSVVLGGDVYIEDVWELKEKVKALGNALREIGFMPGKPRIVNCWSYTY